MRCFLVFHVVFLCSFFVLVVSSFALLLLTTVVGNNDHEKGTGVLTKQNNKAANNRKKELAYEQYVVNAVIFLSDYGMATTTVNILGVVFCATINIATQQRAHSRTKKTPRGGRRGL